MTNETLYTPTREERERREVAEREARWETMFKALTLAGFKVYPVDESGTGDERSYRHNAIGVRSTDGLRISLRYSERLGQYRASPALPHALRMASRYDEPSFEIGMAETKGVVALARDISRRLLPNATAQWERLTAKAAESADYERRKLETYERMVKAYGVVPTDYERGRFTLGRGGVDIRVNGPDSVDVEIRSTSPEQAEKILRLGVKGYQ